MGKVREGWRRGGEECINFPDGAVEEKSEHPHVGCYNGSLNHAWKAWVPWVFLSVFVFLWGLPEVKGVLNKLFAPNLRVPLLDAQVQRIPPVVLAPTPESAVFAFNALSATGTALLLAGGLAAVFRCPTPLTPRP